MGRCPICFLQNISLIRQVVLEKKIFEGFLGFAKSMFPEFNEFIDKFDLIGFQETRTDELDTIDLKDYI